MTNRLARETSPYLTQHAENPVHWQPWDEEALTQARQEDKPILLSIGYSACHWCHVMAHECFEDENLAALMNRLFVCIKVDREERPDLDQIYQLAHQMLTGRPGGWPLNMFLTPDGTPFFGGTYFPKTARYGLPAFGELMQRIAEAFKEQRLEITHQNRKLRSALHQTLPASVDAGDFSRTALDSALAGLAQAFDKENGGFGGAPKFPRPPEIQFLLRRFVEDGNLEARDMALTTLVHMAEGGLYDQLGGGFCRYSVDAEWTIPHFEKMLYDNGPLLRLYADAWALTGNPLFKRVAEDTAAWTLREMQSPAGGFYSALDADSEGEEGRFYVWQPEEVLATLSPEEYAVASLHYGLERPANFEGKHWHLRVVRPLAEIAGAMEKSEDECQALLDGAKTKLFQLRSGRVRPGLDDKVLTSWNGLMIEGLARAAAVFDRPDWLKAAQRAMDFVRTTLWQDGRLLATWKDGHGHLNAYLDDHAFLLNALLELLQAEFRTEDLGFAVQLADALLARFEDESAGGFFFTSHDHEALIHRTKPGQDLSTPAGNGAAVLGLLRLGHLLGETRYLTGAERTLKLFHPQLREDVGASATLLMALEELLAPPEILVLRARAGQQGEMQVWQRNLATEYQPRRLVLSIPAEVRGLPQSLEKAPSENADIPVNAWLCRGVICLPPITKLEALREILKRGDFV